MPANKKFKHNLLSVSVLAGLMLLPLSINAQQVNDETETEVEALDDAEVITVRGIRGSLIQSMNNKRYAGSVVDSISAVDIGKLPDSTIADSLQRITGIQITRSGGEGALVNIRGNGNVSTTLNGEQMLSAGNVTTITPDFADIPSTMVSGLDVYKSSQARNVVSGLAGTIDLKTNRPFMLTEEWTVLGKAEATRGSLGKENDGLVSAFIGYNNDDKYGFTLNLAKSSSHLADYTNGSQGGEPGQYGGWSFNASEAANFVQENVDVNGDGDFNDVYYGFQGHQASNRFIDRDRTGVNSSVQFQLTDSLKLTGDVFYTKLEEYQYFAGVVASQAWQGVTGWYTPTETTEYPNITSQDGVFTTNQGSYYTIQDADYQARAVKTHSQTWAVEKEALNTNLELAFDNGGAFTGKLRWVHGEANNDMSRSVIDSFITSGSQIGDTYHGPGTEFISNANPWGYDGVSATLPDGTAVDAYTQIPVSISYRGGQQNWNFGSIDVTEQDGSITNEVFGSNLNRYSNKSSNLYGEFSNADLDIARFDGSYVIDIDALSIVSSVDFGLRHGQREVSKSGWYGGVARTNAYGDAFLARWKDTATQAPLTLESYIPPMSFTELDGKGMITGISDFHGSTGLGTMYFIDPKAMKDPIAWHNEIYGTNVLVPDAANVYNVKEQTQTVYLQANLDGEIAGMTYTGNIGFRYIKTEFDITQSEGLQGTVANFNGQDFLIGPGILQPDGNKINTVNAYSDLLPALNLALNLDDEQILRFSYTETVSTHNTDQLAGGLTVNRVKNCEINNAQGEEVFCATGGGQNGNPNLQPNRNDNLEASYEWYFSETGMFNLGLFWGRGNTEFRTSLVLRDDIVDSDGVVRGYNLSTGEFTGTVPIQTTETFDVTGDWNFDKPGLEMGYQQGLDFLDGFWSGFGITANYTYSPSESNDMDFYGGSLPGVGNSKHQTNLALWYEKDGIQARIAHNYRSEMFNGVKYEGAYQFAYWTAATSYLDASVSYDLNEMVTFSLQGTNLTEEYQENYHQWESNIDSRVYGERRVTLGVQVKL
jgi:TonB-dependent receptor